MPKNYVLIDFENAQPKNLNILAALVDELRKRKHIVVSKGNIKYTLPAG